MHPTYQAQPGLIEQLINSVSKLPGLGPRSARRIVLHLMRKKETVFLPVLQQLQQVADNIKTCSVCRNLDITDPCHICVDEKRNQSQLCIVEDVADVWALERSRLFHGSYHVLGGTLSAFDGRGPEQLGISQLLLRLYNSSMQEVILALNATADGQTTTHYLVDQLQTIPHIRITKLAQGIPIGGELDYLDDGTLGTAFQSRLTI